MTAQPSNGIPIELPPVQVKPRSNSRLAQLHALYGPAKAKADAAAEELKAVTDGIKAELAQAAAAEIEQGRTRVDLVGEGLPPLRLDHRERWTIDSRKLKREDPETYVRFAKKSSSWYLVPLGADGGES